MTRAGTQPMFRLVAAVVISAVLFASSADAACSGTPPGVAYIDWTTSGQGACPGTAAGLNCTGQCRPGYINLAPVTARCDGSTWAPPSGRCFKACTAPPPAYLLSHGGVWPESCAKSLTGSTCRASCPAGSAAIKCLDDGTWDMSLDGQCEVTPDELRQGNTCGSPSSLPMRIVNGQRWPSSCAGTPVGESCVGACNSGYGNTPPSMPCVADPTSPTGGSFNVSAATGFCTKICPGLPPASLLATGSWPGSCTNLFVNQWCSASCPFGAARIFCAPGGIWDVATFQGQCSNGLVCGTAPSLSPVNTMPFPLSCLDGTKPPGSTCPLECRPGYGTAQGEGPVTFTCTQTGADTAEWQNPVPDRCNRICLGAPPDSLLNGIGFWPADCLNSTFSNAVCQAVCPFGSASIVCANNGNWDSASFQGGCQEAPSCVGPPPLVVNQASWGAECTSSPEGTICKGTCRAGFNGDDPPISLCVSNGTAVAWTAPYPTQCTSGDAPPPRTYFVEPATNEVIVCDDTNSRFQTCQANSGVTPAFGSNPAAPAFSTPIGVAMAGSYVAITESNPSRLRYCLPYSRSFISCTPLISLGDNPTTAQAAQVAVDSASLLSYTALTNEDAIACCDNSTCFTEPVDGMDAPRGVDFKLGQVWVAHAGGVTRCPVTTGECVDNTTCVTTALAIDGNGILVEGGRVYLGKTNSNTVMVCDLGTAPGYVISNCVDSPVPGPFNNAGPAYANLAIGINGQVYAPLFTSGNSANVLAVCPPGQPLTNCVGRSYTIVPSRAFTGFSSVAFSPLSASRIGGKKLKNLLPSAEMIAQGWF